jgi:hypothetical protein
MLGGHWVAECGCRCAKDIKIIVSWSIAKLKLLTSGHILNQYNKKKEAIYVEFSCCKVVSGLKIFYNGCKTRPTVYLTML